MEETLSNHTAAIERQALWAAFILNLVGWYSTHSHILAIGCMWSCATIMAAGISQWYFRRCQPPSAAATASYYHIGKELRVIAIWSWVSSLMVFAIGVMT